MRAACLLRCTAYRCRFRVGSSAPHPCGLPVQRERVILVCAAAKDPVLLPAPGALAAANAALATGPVCLVGGSAPSPPARVAADEEGAASARAVPCQDSCRTRGSQRSQGAARVCVTPCTLWRCDSLSLAQPRLPSSAPLLTPPCHTVSFLFVALCFVLADRHPPAAAATATATAAPSWEAPATSARHGGSPVCIHPQTSRLRRETAHAKGAVDPKSPSRASHTPRPPSRPRLSAQRSPLTTALPPPPRTKRLLLPLPTELTAPRAAVARARATMATPQKGRHLRVATVPARRALGLCCCL